MKGGGGQREGNRYGATVATKHTKGDVDGANKARRQHEWDWDGANRATVHERDAKGRSLCLKANGGKA